MDELGMSCVALHDVPDATFNGFTKRLRPKGTIVVPEYARYYFRSPIFRAEVTTMSSLSTRASLNNEMLGRLFISFPPEKQQEAIAHILGTLDDKIDLNRRMNETLEAMARALFKSWFVDFDPVRAKMEGRWRRGESLPGLPAHLYELFPDRLVDSELGEIPEGWGVTRLEDHFEATKGVSYKGSGLRDAGVPLHNLNSIYEGGGYKHEGIKYYCGDYAARHTVRTGDLIVANTEQGHDRLLIGYAALIPDSFGETGIASHHLYRLRPRPRSPLTNQYLCFLLNSAAMHGVVSSYANGTTVNMLPPDGVAKPTLVLPPATLIKMFDGLMSVIGRRKGVTMAESRTLTNLRDTLLPKLVSGELRIEDPDQLIEEVGL
jgi:type I restriction enzyme S subunit